MTLDELKWEAERYVNSMRTEKEFRKAIVEYLATATPDDYMALALWLKTQGRMQ